MIKAILLDVYGTLLTTDLEIAPYSDLLRAYQLDDRELEEARRDFMTTPYDTIDAWVLALSRQYPDRVVSKEILHKVETELKRHQASFRLFDGAAAVLDGLRGKGYVTAIVTNLSTTYKEPILRLGLDELVDYRVYSCDVGFMKPEREIFEIALGAVEAAAGEAVMVGDNLADDVEGAKNAGIRPIHIEAGVHGALPSLLELPEHLERLI
ncbi:MAG: HAD family hydrolase [Candidatus Eisenbacteria bacterium]|uniref:HAD family hydrolase n=1 Tax=Eiseniibacteriota bacterium TaxID=2212470 RepID=A0A948W5J2_UNCEI|nr:HAD family hydrolase [Candidatus Eisenbacteria bacterium]MBU1951026.1 HAD family hydrolase [Candidatus Eisenbacteria bacterium]MBU2690055.1 HAD family hydrolase [Candidatus Eisenbacteria bacterium]